MSLPLLALAVVGALVLGYTLYGRFVARQYALDDARTTPAERVNDGVDFVPAKPFYLLGQHLSAIAAAGPIAGPILACQGFGWLPCLLWIVLGVVLIGSVHDFSALVASVRHGAASIAEIVRQQLGPRAWLGIMAFIWLALVYVIIAFTDVTAATFLGRGENVEGATSFDKGGAVAAASISYLLLAILLGVVQRLWKPPLWATTLIFVPATLGCVVLGTQISTAFVASHATWVTAILLYCFVASLLPVWTLLQPRGYLGGFVLYLSLLVGVVGIFFGGFEIRQPATTSAPLVGIQGSLFPFLFVTIACGACSGFHGLVCSGTTSKQVARESHCRPVGFGGMLLEGFVAVIALATIMIVAPSQVAGRQPGTIYGEGLAAFLGRLFGNDHRVLFATFGTMVFSTFVFDTLDVATRLGRYILQELTGHRGAASAAVATALTAGIPLAVLLATGEGSYKTFWILFGTSNQLLAGLTLLAITVWLKSSGKRTWFTAIPMAFVLGITLWSLTAQAIEFFGRQTDTKTGALVPAMLANGVVSVLLVGLAALLLVEGLRVKASTLLFLYAGALVAAGVIAFLSAPKGASAKTALIVPGACAVLVLGCALMASGVFGGASGPRLGRTAGWILALAIGVLVTWRAYAAGEAVRSYRDGVTAYEREVAEKRVEASDEARARYLRDLEVPDHDKTYLRNLLWALTVVSVAAGVAVLTSKT